VFKKPSFPGRVGRVLPLAPPSPPRTKLLPALPRKPTRSFTHRRRRLHVDRLALPQSNAQASATAHVYKKNLSHPPPPSPGCVVGLNSTCQSVVAVRLCAQPAVSSLTNHCLRCSHCSATAGLVRVTAGQPCAVRRCRVTVGPHRCPTHPSSPASAALAAHPPPHQTRDCHLCAFETRMTTICAQSANCLLAHPPCPHSHSALHLTCVSQ
jgi:hypothetical protein